MTVQEFKAKMDKDLLAFQSKADNLKNEINEQFKRTIQKIENAPISDKWENINRIINKGRN